MTQSNLSSKMTSVSEITDEREIWRSTSEIVLFSNLSLTVNRIKVFRQSVHEGDMISASFAYSVETRRIFFANLKGIVELYKCLSEIVVLVQSYDHDMLRSLCALKYPCDQILGVPHCYIFVKSMTFLLNLPNFKSLSVISMESYLFRRFLFKIIRPPLIKHVPEVTSKRRS